MTQFSFAMPSFFSGAARILDFAGVFDSYDTSPSAKETDARAIYADWRAVGEDLWTVMSEEIEEDPAPQRNS